MTSPTEVEGGSSPCDDPDPFAPTPPPRTHSTRAGLVPVDHLHMNIKVSRITSKIVVQVWKMDP